MGKKSAALLMVGLLLSGCASTFDFQRQDSFEDRVRQYGNLIRWSEQFRELIGYSQSEFPDGWDSYFQVVNADDLMAVMQAFNASMVDKSGDGFYAVEYRMRHKSRGEIWYRERGRCLRDSHGVLVRVIGAVRDISDEKAAEALRQAELERAVRLLAKGEDPQRVLEALSHGLTNKLMHGPTRFLNQAEGEHKAEAGRVVRELFNLSRDHH